MDTVTIFAACAMTLAQPGGTPCGNAFDPLRVVTSPIGAQQTSDFPPEFDRRLAQHAVSLIDRWEPYIAEAAQRFVIPQDWIRAVMHSESGGRTTLDGRPITSVAGAMGLMQLMPGTYTDMRQRYGLGRDSYDPHDNILAGAAYLGLMYRQYGYPGLFAAYNAGPARFDGYLLRGKSLPSATLAYVGSIVPGVETTMGRSQVTHRNAIPIIDPQATNGYRGAPQQGLFFVLNQSPGTQFLAHTEASITSKSPPASTTNTAPIREFESQNPATQAGGLFVPLSRTNP